MSLKKNKIVIKLVVIILMILGVFFTSNRTRSPMISVIMPVYNRSEFIGKAIESVLKQTYRDFELIIVNDGSKDNSLDIIQKYAHKDKRIKIFSLPQNHGISYARNLGIKNAQGKYLATMDSDDSAYIDWLKISVDYMEKNPNVTVGFVRADYYFDNGKGFEQYKSKYYTKIRKFIYSSMANVGTLYRLDFIRKNNITYNEAYLSAEDYDFIAQIIMNGGRIEYVHPLKSLVLYRLHNTNHSKYYQEGAKNQTKVWQKLNTENIKKDKCDTAKQFIKKYPNAFSLFQKQLAILEACQQKPYNVLKLKHHSWEGEMIKDKKQSYMCFVNKTTHCAYIVDEKEDEMTLHWEIYNTKETFVETIDGTYVLKSMLKNI